MFLIGIFSGTDILASAEIRRCFQKDTEYIGEMQMLPRYVIDTQIT